MMKNFYGINYFSRFSIALIRRIPLGWYRAQNNKDVSPNPGRHPGLPMFDPIRGHCSKSALPVCCDGLQPDRRNLF